MNNLVRQPHLTKIQLTRLLLALQHEKIALLERQSVWEEVIRHDPQSVARFIESRCAARLHELESAEKDLRDRLGPDAPVALPAAKPAKRKRRKRRGV